MGAGVRPVTPAPARVPLRGVRPVERLDGRTGVGTVEGGSERWIFDSASSPPNVKYFSHLTPGIAIDAGLNAGDKYYGKVSFADVHVGSGGSMNSAPVPASCSV